MWKGFISFTSLSQLIIKGSRGQNSHRAGTWKRKLTQRLWVSVTGVLLMAASACFLIEPRQVVPPTRGCALQNPSLIKEMPSRLAHSLILGRHSPY